MRGWEEARAAVASSRALHGDWGQGFQPEKGLRRGGPCSGQGLKSHLWPQRGLHSQGARVEGGKDRLSVSSRESGRPP